MRTTMPTAATVACAVLFTLTACGPSSGAAEAKPSPSATPSPPAAPDPLAGKDPAAVLRAAYEETQNAPTKDIRVSRRTGERQLQAYLTVTGEDWCYGRVTVMKAGTADIVTRHGVFALKGAEGFLEDHFGGRSRPEPDDEGWISLKTSDPSVAHLLDLCREGLPAKTFPAERTNIRREADTFSSQRRVAVFRSTVPGGAEITDHVLIEGTPHLMERRTGGPDFAHTSYEKLRPATPAGSAGPA
ncbi:hypothetical protein [Streptomyces sp. NPDC057939]|uniref:hypothetical protein n=1 Tax=Streptomyces sp. NPDC057939 TaxID=3346284 RepID=UPI0036E01CAE